MTSTRTSTDSAPPAREPGAPSGAGSGTGSGAAAREVPAFSPEHAVSVHTCRGLILVAALGLWQLGAGRVFDAFFFSTPSRIFAQVVTELLDPGFYADLAVTAVEMIAGFAIGGAGGVVLGVLLARWAFVNKVLDPFLLALYAIPRIALAPMLIVWFGIGYASKIFLAATLVFFITFFNTISGVRSVDKALCDVARVQKATEWQIFWKVMLPGASSWILTSLKISLPMALVGVILGEFLVSSAGLGYRLNAYSTNYNITGALAIVFLMMVLMLILTAVTDAVEARVLRWRPKSAAERVTHEP